MSLERPGYQGDIRDLGTEKYREMSRVFICQPKNTDQIREELLSGKTPAELSFVNLILAEKSADSISPNQLFPVGGSKRAGDKDSLEVARRRMLEETHLRPVKIKKLGAMKYSLKDPRQQQPENISATYFLAEVLPFDVAYSLNPQDDKIAGYHQVDLQTYRDEILRKGFYTVDAGKESERKLPLMDSLRINYKNDSSEDGNIVDNVPAFELIETQNKLMEGLENKDYTKSCQIINNLIALLKMDQNATEFWLNELEETKDHTDTAKLIKELSEYAVKEYFDGDLIKFNELFLAAFDLSNFEDEVSKKYAGRSRNEMVLRVVFSLLESKFKYDRYLELVKLNPDLVNFATRLESFVATLSSESNPDDNRQNLVHQLKGIDEVDPELVEEAFFEAFFDQTQNNEQDKVDFKKKITKTLSNIDSLLDEKIIRSKLAPIVRDQYNERLLTQMGEIRNASISTLMKYALPGVGKKEKRRFKTSDKENAQEEKAMLRRVVFEARRKLALLFILLDADHYYEKIVHEGIGEIQDLWNETLEPPRVDCYLSEDRNESNELLDVKTSFVPPENGNAQKMVVRPFKDNSDEVVMLVSPTSRRKEVESFERKMISRGYDGPEEIKDIYGRSLVVMPAKNKSMEQMLKKEERVIEVCDKDQNGNMFCEDRSFVDHAAVFNIIESLQKNKYVKILEYKPTNEPGTAFASSGSGGEAPIRLAKFYIQHTDNKGVVRFEEVQIFSPSADGRSGFYWEKKKKEDDEIYAFERLLRTKGVHSFIEILFPALIYGKPIQNVNNKKRS